MREDSKAPYKTILYRKGKGTNGKVTGNRIKTLRGLKSRSGQKPVIADVITLTNNLKGTYHFPSSTEYFRRVVC